MRLSQSQRIFICNIFLFALGFWFGLIFSNRFHLVPSLINTTHDENKSNSEAVIRCKCSPSLEPSTRSITPAEIYVQSINPQAADLNDSIHSRYSSAKLDAALAKDRKLLSSKVTVVSYCNDEQEYRSLNRFMNDYPDTRLLVASAKGSNKGGAFNYTYMGEFGSKGEALNKLIATVETDYFLHLDSYHNVNDPNSDQGVGWLLQAMEKVKSLDIIGGSLHVEKAHRGVDDTLEIPCYRLHHYNYTYSETYEYKESILDIMLCERTSTSFLANTTTFRRRALSFDPNLGGMLFEDFFLQVKAKGVVVATKPEVYFKVLSVNNKQPSAVQHVTTKFIADLIPFGLKHQVMTIRDLNELTLYICERYSTLGTMFEDKALGRELFKDEVLLCEYDRTRPYWKMKHWAYSGMFAPPTMMIALKRSLLLVGEFFDAKGWVWYIFGGGELGAVKTRGFLPWEAGDIDISLNITQKECWHVLKTEFELKYPDYQVLNNKMFNMHSFELLIRPKHGFGGWVTLFFGVWRDGPIRKTLRMKLDGYWVQCSYYMFKDFKKWFGLYYLQHKMYNKKHMQCLEKSNTCLPDYRKMYGGRGGIWKEFFQEQ